MSIRFSFRACVIAFAYLGLAIQVLRADEWTLTGPLIAHDPTIVKEGDTWWCFYTGAGTPVKSSPDGLVWTQRENFFTKELPWWRNHAPAMGALDVWAPDIHKFGDRYWLYYSVSEFGKNNSAIGLMSCTSIAAGDWKDEGHVISSKNGVQPYNAIDPGLVIDADGKPWLSFGSWFTGICLVSLDPGTMKPNGPVQTLAFREAGIEGPNIVYYEGYYYLFVSIDRCCIGVSSTYKTSFGRSRSIHGPYLDKAGVDMMAGGGTILEVGGGPWIGPGGGSVIQCGAEWIFARHAYDANNSGKPALRITDLYWDTEGWPTLTRLAAPIAPDLKGGSVGGNSQKEESEIKPIRNIPAAPKSP